MQDGFERDVFNSSDSTGALLGRPSGKLHRSSPDVMALADGKGVR
jgi:hypothetical protein